MIRRSGFQYPDVILAATIEERNRRGVREAYYTAKNLKRAGKEFVEGDFSEQEKFVAASRVCNKIIHEVYISRVVDTLLEAYWKSDLYKCNNLLKIKIVFPLPVTGVQSANALSPVFVVLLENKLREALRKKDPYNRMRSVVERDFNVRLVMKVGRTVTLSEDDSKEEKLFNFVGLLAKQPLFEGTVDRDAIYLLADDSVRRQTTFANLAAFLASHGGTIGAATALIGVPESAKMQVCSESLELLQAILGKRNLSSERLNEVLSDSSLFGNLNLRTGTKEQNTLTNLETLLLASYFGSSEDKKEFEDVLELAGSTRDEKGSISDYLKLASILELGRSPGSLEELRNILVMTLKKKKLLH